ncbi:MAG: Gfo/Idh/MocA family protein [Armatimonadota bacterium]
MPDRLRVAVIGCGGIARDIYLPLLDVHDGAAVCACVDASAAVRERMFARYRGAAHLASAHELDADGCDCALVLTPVREGLDAHYEPVLALMRAGVPTLCEKPLSADLGRAQEMVEAAEAAGTVLMMSVNRRFAPVYRRAAEHFAGHAIEVCAAEKSGAGGIFRELVTNSIHALDAMRWLCGEVAQVSGWCVSEGEIDLRVSAAMRFEGGALGSFVMSRAAGRWIERMVLHGAGRTAIIDAPHAVETIADGQRVCWCPDQACWQMPEPQRWGFAAQLDHFLACVRGDEKSHVPARDALASQRLAERVRSLRT